MNSVAAPMKTILAGFAAAAVCLAPLAAAQAQAPQMSSASHIDLDVGKGRLIHLDAPATGVFVGDPKVADVQVKSPTLIYLVGVGPGETTVMAVDAHDLALASLQVQVDYNLTGLKRDLKRLAPGSDLEVSTVNNALVLTGQAGSLGEAETARTIAQHYVPDNDHLINLMRVDGPNQINLRVRVVEVSRDVIKAFGINWTGNANPGSLVVGAATGVNGITPAAGSSILDAVPGLQGVSNLLLGLKTNRVDLNTVIDALDSEGLITVLAEPNLTSLSGSSASFLAGGEYPIPVPQGLGQVTIDFKKYGVSLDSLATITDDGRIRLTVRPEVSQLSQNGAISLNGVIVPALTTRRAETTVELARGQSFAIAGLLQNNITHNLQKVPGLGNMGVLGSLFRSDRFERAETELVIVVTPYLVKPSSTRLAVPTDGYLPPTDAARVLGGADYTRAAPPPAAAAPSAGAAPVKVGHP